IGAVIDADDVANRVDLHVVESAVGAHPVRKTLRDRAMRVGEISNRELAALGVAGIAMRRKPLGPVPDPIAELGRVAELVVETYFRDAVDVAQAFGELEIRVIAEPPLERGDDVALGQAEAARSAHR